MATPPDELFEQVTDPGVLLWDKAAGETSHDVVETVRRKTGLKAGHAGTLDPFATGLLLILIGRATRLQRFLLPLPKTYLATARLGWSSSTGDRDGELEYTGRTPDRLEIPIGSQDQMVPMTSAARVGGERLYRKAQRGETLASRPVREVTVHRSELLSREDERAVFELEVSSGTYVRTLVEALGDAYCEELRRTAIGPFSVDGAGSFLTPLEALAFLPVRELNPDELPGVRNGVAVQDPEGSFNDGDSVLLANEGRLIAIAEAADGKLKPVLVLEGGG